MVLNVIDCNPNQAGKNYKIDHHLDRIIKLAFLKIGLWITSLTPHGQLLVTLGAFDQSQNPFAQSN